MKQVTRWLVLAASAHAAVLVNAADDAPPGDAWITGAAASPAEFHPAMLASNRFAALHAEMRAGRLKIVLPSEGFATNASVRLHFSFDEPGHWPARDWESAEMFRGAQFFEATIRVTDLEVPVVYFANLTESAGSSRSSGTNQIASPLRVCRPDRLGMDTPSHPFWPFLEGFEESLESWRLATDGPPLAADSAAHTGKAALRVELPEGRSAVTVATTRLRGWHVTVREALGVRLWLRTKAGEVRARFGVVANAETSRQQVATFQRSENIGQSWRKVDLWFADLPGWHPAGTDLLSIDFIGEGPREILVDDVWLLGRWRVED